ncbi:MAG: hypothetical protein PHQ35_03715 [Phycisphaerae bacterium]|nr:hypothetical protein [Phycisphaerae bacterium]MDD5380600.1 hypothetical protein [Phycisphaerae bacterium]
MSNSYSSLCDDFYLDMHLNTKLPLPRQRDTILAFFERIQKQFPSMGRFFRNKNQYCLEEDCAAGQYRWITLETDRISSGVANPSSFEDAYNQDKLVIELAPYMLSVNHLDIDSLDVTFAMDFDYAGSHDEVIAEALLGSTAFNCLLDLPAAKPIVFSPTVVVALSDDCLTQCRINIESKTSIYEPGEKRQVEDEAINLSFTIRQYPSSTEKFDALKSFENQCRLAEELMAEKIVSNFVQPLINVIAQKRST